MTPPVRDGDGRVGADHDGVQLSRSDDLSAEPYAVGDYELASRLSYFIWSSMPDEPLLQLAAEGKLRDDRVLEEQARLEVGADHGVRNRRRAGCTGIRPPAAERSTQ